jgi:hypothetical protein
MAQADGGSLGERTVGILLFLLKGGLLPAGEFWLVKWENGRKRTAWVERGVMAEALQG